MSGSETRIHEKILALVERRLRELEDFLGDPLLYIRKGEFDNVIRKYRIVVVDFSAPWCNPCKAYLPVFRRVARRLSSPEKGVVFAYLDTDESPEIADRYHVDNIPTTIIYVDGHVADVIVGVTQERNLEERIQRIIESVVD